MRIVLELQACLASSRHRGIGRYSMALAQAMVQQGRQHEFHIVLNRHYPEAYDDIRRAFAGLVPNDRITTFDVPRPVAEIFPQNAWRVRSAEQLREAYLAQLAPDVVHVSSLFEGLGEDAVASVGAFSSAAQFDTAVTLYDLIPLLRRETYLTGAEVRDWYFRKLQSLKNSELLLAISGHSRVEAIAALQLPEQQIVNISSAVDGSFYQRTLGQDERNALHARYGLTRAFVMYTGGIDYRKNIEGLIEAFARLPQPLRSQHQLAIICSIQTPDRIRLELLATQLGLAKDELVLTGFVPDADLVALYNCTALFVFPSLQEGFGLPALEAMSCGAATIGSNTSSIPEVIGRADALFDPTDLGAITQKMASVLTDGDFRRSLQAHGLQQAKLFSWAASADKALAAFEEVHARRLHASPVSVAWAPARPPRLRLAFVSPLPPEQSGIADYSAQLLPELARHYDIEVIVTQDEITDSWITANFPVRSASWFEQHADRFDRILYHFGNSEFHTHMFGALARYPGVVVLHDFFLSGIVNHVERAATWPNAFCRSLYESHGYPALLTELELGRNGAIYHFPCNKPVLDNAVGVIVHSQYSIQLARQWYGPAAADGWRYVPLLKAVPATIDRNAARALLGFAETDFLVCSFGHLGATKLNVQLLDAWLSSPMAADPHCHLIFVGANDATDHGIIINKAIERSGHTDRIRITGFNSPEVYRAYLSCTDIAVQLRAKSRGETSAAILDCLSYGIATIVNANGSAAELSDDILLKLPDHFTPAALHDALITLWRDAGQRQVLSAAAAHFVQVAHQPSRIGDAYRDAIETFADTSPAAQSRALLASLATINTVVRPTPEDFDQLAASLLANQPAPTPNQLLVDVSAWIAHHDALSLPGSGTALLRELILNPPAGYRVEPFYMTGTLRRYARHFILGLIGRPELVLEDSPLEIRRGDRILHFVVEAGIGRTIVTDDGWAVSNGVDLLGGLLDEMVAATCAGLLRDLVSASAPGTQPEVQVVAVADAMPIVTLEQAELQELARDAVRISVEPQSTAEDTSLVGAEVTIEKLDTGAGFSGSTTRSTRHPMIAVDRSMPQILVDITVLAGSDDKSGIQRVVRSILQALLDAPPPGFVVMPIRDAGGYYAYARRFMQQTDAVQAEINEDEPIHLSAADIFLGLDLAPNHVTQNAALYADFKRHGVQIFFVVYDLLPVLHAEVFLPGASQWFSRWLETISTAADGLICISRAVADDLGNWLEQNDPQRLDALQIGYFHLGADIEASQPTSGMTATDVEVLKRMAARPSFLMVGTLEPRKSHLQALHAFELLWESGADINLIIVGKQGWMVEALVEKLRNHPEKDRRLLWLERISDEMLLKLYAAASALLAPSIAEGFGLPLIESAIQGLPIIARDLPVFREVCNEHAFYFTGDTAAVLADAVRNWMALDVRQEAPQSATMPRLNWSQSAAQLLDVIVAGHWYRLSAGQPAEAIA